MMFSGGRSTAYHRGKPVSIPGQLMQAFRWLKFIAGFPVNTSVFLCKESFHQSTILIHSITTDDAILCQQLTASLNNKL